MPFFLSEQVGTVCIHIPAYLSVYLPTYLHTYLPTYLPTFPYINAKHPIDMRIHKH